MGEGPNIAGIAALIGDRGRAEILTALMAGRALTATELAEVAGITKQTASAHLSKLLGSQLVAVESQGRHRYFRIADADVAQLIERLMSVAGGISTTRKIYGPRDPALRKARVCYDHLAGELAVLVFDSLHEQRLLSPHADGLQLTEQGMQLFARLGIDTASLQEQRRSFCRACLDWSERRNHLAGALGAALLERILELRWARRKRDSRVVVFSVDGERALRKAFGLAHLPYP